MSIREKIAFLSKREPELEQEISQDYIASYLYARDIIKGRFELGEAMIANSGPYSYRYAKLINQRFEPGEIAMRYDTALLLDYAVNIAKCRLEYLDKLNSVIALNNISISNIEPSINPNGVYNYLLPLFAQQELLKKYSQIK